MKGHGQKLTRKQERLIAAMLTESSYEKAAQVAGVGRSTMFRWLELPEFQEAYAAARQRVLDQAVALLLALSRSAVATLAANLKSKDPQASTRAALAILDRGIRGVETLNVLARLEALERCEHERKEREQRAYPRPA